MKDTQFMSADEKFLVKKYFANFLKLLTETDDEEKLFRAFTKRVYEHLHLYCGFIAHMDRHGFFNTYFNGDVDDLRTFLENFVDEEGKANPYTYPDMDDINEAMAKSAENYYPFLMDKFNKLTKQEDIEKIKFLIKKQGLDLKDFIEEKQKTLI